MAHPLPHSPGPVWLVRLRPPVAALVVAAALALPACDGSAPGDEPARACAAIGVPETGSVTATTPDGPFETACASVTGADGLLVIAREPGAGPLAGRTVELYVDGLGPGTYTVGADDRSALAAYGPGPGATAPARSGSITVESSEGGLRGTFAFVTAAGAEVTGGRFDLDL